MINLSRSIFLEQGYFYEFAWNFKVFPSFYVIKLSISKCILQELNYFTEPNLFICRFSLDILGYQIYLTSQAVSPDVNFVPD